MDLHPDPTVARPSATAPGQPTASGTGADDRSTSFRPVEGGNEMQSGEKLLVEAYAAIWLILFALVLFSWRRQRRLDERMGELSAAIDKARQRESGKGGE
jgi:CcmD family protein